MRGQVCDDEVGNQEEQYRAEHIDAHVGRLFQIVSVPLGPASARRLNSSLLHSFRRSSMGKHVLSGRYVRRPHVPSHCVFVRQALPFAFVVRQHHPCGPTGEEQCDTRKNDWQPERHETGMHERPPRKRIGLPARQFNGNRRVTSDTAIDVRVESTGAVAVEVLDRRCVPPGDFVDGDAEDGGDLLALGRAGRPAAERDGRDAAPSRPLRSANSATVMPCSRQRSATVRIMVVGNLSGYRDKVCVVRGLARKMIGNAS